VADCDKSGGAVTRALIPEYPSKFQVVMVSRSRSRGRSRNRRGARSRASNPQANPSRKAPQKMPNATAGSILGNRPIQSIIGRVARPKLSDAGLAFLKCAFAAPDFAIDPGKGIPDNYTGRTLSVKDNTTAAINFAAGQDTFIVVLPIPGYAYFTATVATGTDPTIFTGVPFTTYATNFGTIGAGNPIAFYSPNYNQFRYASMAVGMYPTSNLMQFAGSVSVWKVDMSFGRTAGTVLIPPAATPGTQSGAIFDNLYGASSVTSLVPRDNYTESFIKGCYSMSLDRTGTFQWNDFVPDSSYSQYPGAVSFNQASSSQPLTGFGNMEAIIIKVSSPTGSVNSANLKVWNCVEMQVNTSSPLYQFSGVSPPFDPNALEVYGKIRNELPVAVPCAQNESFWARVLNIVKSVAGMASYVPGPIGLIGSGIAGLL
jgi:hypothetical protein